MDSTSAIRPAANQPPTYVADIGNAQEIAFTTSGGLGESETAGLVMNVVPKTGGNEVHGVGVFTAAPARICRRTIHAAQGRLAAATPLNKRVRPQHAVGGPIMKDRVWYFAQRPHAGQHSRTSRASTTTECRRPDAVDCIRRILDQPQFTDRTWENISGRITWQATPRNKIGGFWDEQVGLPQVRRDDVRASPIRRACRPRRWA